MSKYILETDKKKINDLIKDTNINNIDYLKEEIDDILINCKDYSIDDTINYILNNLINEMRPLLLDNLTPGIEIGLKNKYFNLYSYGGKYNKDNNSKDIDINTYFSFDSISKLLTSVIAMNEVKNGNISMDTKIKDYNNNFSMDATLASILKFTGYIRTPKRIDNLSKEETIDILKNVKENLEEKNKYTNFYEYNDIGYMILRGAIYNFTDKLDKLLLRIDNNNLSYKNIDNKDNITGGKYREEYITPDTKGRGIDFPGHTGLYGNIIGLINMFDMIINKEDILTNKDKEVLFLQPYSNPVVYDINGNVLVGKNGSKQYMAKVAGIYRRPSNISDPNYNKMASCDMSDKTTDKAMAATGTCGAWVVSDNISNKHKFGTYTGGFLTNPYSYIETREYDKNEEIVGTPHKVTPKGVILGYQTRLNKYK